MKLKKGKSLCFFSAKGGVGKSVNILNERRKFDAKYFSTRNK